MVKRQALRVAVPASLSLVPGEGGGWGPAACPQQGSLGVYSCVLCHLSQSVLPTAAMGTSPRVPGSSSGNTWWGLRAWLQSFELISYHNLGFASCAVELLAKACIGKRSNRNRK